MMYIVFVSAAMYLVYMLDATNTLIGFLVFDPVLILFHGQVWRLVTWLFVPSSGNLLFTVLALYFYYFIGSTLEREWSTAKFNVFYILGVILNLVYAFAMWLILGIDTSIGPVYLNFSMFFAFAIYYPDFVIRVFFIIPVKIKWLALINGFFFAYQIAAGLLMGNTFLALMPVVALLNFFVICCDEILSYLRPLKARTNPQAINFKRAARKAKRDQSHTPYRHKCAVCGKTDTEYPGLEFRYCSRCEGYHCYCIEHINKHIHFQGRSTDL